MYDVLSSVFVRLIGPKTKPTGFCHNFCDLLIFKILSLAHTAINLQ